jgi:hypothetical protein
MTLKLKCPACGSEEVRAELTFTYALVPDGDKVRTGTNIGWEDEHTIRPETPVNCGDCDWDGSYESLVKSYHYRVTAWIESSVPLDPTTVTWEAVKAAHADPNHLSLS